jgi:hypothetical protein
MSFGPYLPTVLYSVCEDNSWGKPRITDQKNLAQEPSLYVNHYGQGLFEGIKAKKVKIGAGTHKPAREEVIILAPLLHFNRLNRGMFRLGMPEVPEKLFLTSIENFIQEIWESIPFGENQYLYVRPLARGIGEHIPEERSPGVFGNKNFDFTILGSPLHTEPLVRLKIHLEQTYTRTAKGGTGDSAATYFLRTECVAGVQDMRFQQLMPDVLHWMGMKHIDRLVSMSNMKYDAIVGSGITVGTRVDIPEELVPKDAQVEMEAKKAAGYFTPGMVKGQDELKTVKGRALQE